MKGKYLALSLAAVILLSACGLDKNGDNDFKVRDPLLEDGGQNDIGK
ncbi:hypothetical protein OXB_2476 [Bacillus sp. OxB-1]|nr:hypothetical protein OXB_2476 [Bacillus sp. OxB-1]